MASSDATAFKYNSLPLLGSWTKPASNDPPPDHEDPGVSLLSSKPANRVSVVELLEAAKAKEAAEEAQAEHARKSSEQDGYMGLGEDVEEFIEVEDPSAPSWTPQAQPEARPSYKERQEAHQEASRLLAEHRKQRMPWMTDVLDRIRSPLLRLHTEITEFVRLVTPTPEEKEARRAALSRAKDLVNSIWPDAKLEVFGSYATDLYLPTSDIDCVVLESGCTDIPAGLKALATASLRKGIAKNIQVIAKATVPLFKFEDVETGVKIDLSFDVANGPQAAGIVSELMEKLSPMRPLVIVLKVFLQQRELNEVYAGGIGSYALLVMVAAFLQLHPSRKQVAMQSHRGSVGEIEGSLGVLLVDFMRLYGRTLNSDTTGVSCCKGGYYFNKEARNFLQDHRPTFLSIEDPNDSENDLGRNSYNILHVKAAFDHAYHELTAPASRNESVLARIFRLDPVLMERSAPVAASESEEEEGEAVAKPDAEKQIKSSSRAIKYEPAGQSKSSGKGKKRDSSVSQGDDRRSKHSGDKQRRKRSEKSIEKKTTR